MPECALASPGTTKLLEAGSEASRREMESASRSAARTRSAFGRSAGSKSGWTGVGTALQAQPSG